MFAMKMKGDRKLWKEESLTPTNGVRLAFVSLLKGDKKKNERYDMEQRLRGFYSNPENYYD